MSQAKIITDPVPDMTCIVVGTRPGIIKMSPLIAELESRGVPSFTIHAGQHYTYELDGKLFEDLNLNPPEYHLEEVKQAEFHGEQTAKMLEGIEQALLEQRPENVLVCGDANFNLAGALAARKLGLSLGHVEAGLRSLDWRMPEEHNRVMIDHISDFLFAPTEQAKENALRDNVRGEVIVTGNTIVDAVDRNIDIALELSTVQKDLELVEQRYAVFTAHREENVDNPETLRQLVDILLRLAEEGGMRVVYPVHPRTVKRLKQQGLQKEAESIAGVEIINPLGYLDFLSLLSKSAVAVTDSGGIQEEACILGVPCVTLRENTERPETVDIGANTVCGTEPTAVLQGVHNALAATVDWSNPFGDGQAAKSIIDEIL